MFTSILVPLDGTRESEVALSPARMLTSTLGAEIILLRVVPTDGKVSVLSTPELNEASDYLESVASRLHKTDVHIEVVVSHGGERAERCVIVARMSDSDMRDPGIAPLTRATKLRLARRCRVQSPGEPYSASGADFHS